MPQLSKEKTTLPGWKDNNLVSQFVNEERMKIRFKGSA